MRSDDSAVAGFFEDIPVLVIVLTGVCSLVLSGVLASERIAYVDLQSDLDTLAERLICRVVIWVQNDPSVDHASVASFKSVNISRCADEVLNDESYRVMIVQRLPCVGWVRMDSDPVVPALVLRTGYASGIFNARLDDGTIGVVEVAAIVWR